MIIKHKNDMMQSWHQTRLKLILFLAVSISVIILVIFAFSTYLVNNMYLADQRRLMILHEMEYSNKLASIGRLAAGVAHEINNPLAIINEKAGLIKDLFTYTDTYAADTRIVGLINSVLSSVERCGIITKRLLGFARHMEVSLESINIGTIINEVLGFLHKVSGVPQHHGRDRGRPEYTGVPVRPRQTAADLSQYRQQCLLGDG